MPDTVADNQFYGELASWWPLISPVEDYAGEAAYVRSLLPNAQTPRRTLLELGSGGGCMAFYLKADFAMTLADLSPQMLAVSANLNPDCEHLLADMRTMRLRRQFDIVFAHDAIMYMTTEADLHAAMTTAFKHCRPGGLAVFVPDDTTEIFEPESDVGGTDGDDGRGVRFLDWTHDPDPADDWVATEYAFVLRHAEGSIRLVHETHRTGLFTRSTWLRLLGDVGFVAERVTETTEEDRHPRDVFVAVRPAR